MGCTHEHHGVLEFKVLIYYLESLKFELLKTAYVTLMLICTPGITLFVTSTHTLGLISPVMFVKFLI